MARPMPLPPPVTRTTEPEKSKRAEFTPARYPV